MTSRYTILHVCPCPSILSPEDPAYIMLRLCAVVLDMGSRRPVIAWCSTYLCVKIGTTHVADSMAAAVSEGVTCLLQWLQYAIWERHKVRTVRRTLAQIAEQGSLDSSGNLSIDGQHIAVCYYRAGYAPTDYPSEAEWTARSVYFLHPLQSLLASGMPGSQLTFRGPAWCL